MRVEAKMKCPVCGGNVGTIKLAFGEIICYFCRLNVDEKLKEYSRVILAGTYQHRAWHGSAKEKKG